MSIKDLFNNTGTKKIQKAVSSDDLVTNVESKDFVESKRKQKNEFIPPIDFSTSSNFAKFGSAELYYEKAFERIHQYYPYDGTLHEKLEFENSSSYLDKYVFDNLYPRTNGYLTFNGVDQYITVFGGIHTASAGMANKTLESTFDSSMKFDELNKRTSAFEFRGEDGITVEFWFKAAGLSGDKNIFHVSGSNAGQIKLEQQSKDLHMVISSGSATDFEPDFENIITDTNWNHYAISVLSSSNGLTAKSYKNGQLFEHQASILTNIPHILPQIAGLNMRIARDWQNSANRLEGSLDEFRYWKTARTPEQIFNNWFLQIGGGSNNHDANVELGTYLKFNEGITGIDSVDNIVLDYSGRINNGVIEGYASSMRNTGSAIREKLSQTEFLDPIIYSFHPDVVARKEEYRVSGSLSDLESTSMFYNYFPGWMQEEDEQNGKQLKYLSQIIGSYFDTIWHQINFIDKVHDNQYVKGDDRPFPFSRKILENKGFVVPDLFVDANIVENLRGKDDNQIYDKELFEIKNTIYHNIHNNLDAIYKSKGTEKSFRNLFRAIGIGQDIVKLRMYADDSTFVLRNNYQYKSHERKYINFSPSSHSGATIYQTSSVNNTNIFIPADELYTGSFSFETEVILPRKQRKNESNYDPFPYLSSSIVGYKEGIEYETSSGGLQVYVVHYESESSLGPNDSQMSKFILTGSNINLTSSWFRNQYENNKWTLAVRMKHSSYPRINVTGTLDDDYLLEFYGVEANGNDRSNHFLLSTSSVNHSCYSSNKIFYAGSNRTNFTGSSIKYSDVKLGYVRYWHSYLSDDAIDQHAFDTEAYGTNNPHEQDLINVYPVEVPREKTLAFHWAFNVVTGSDSSGNIEVVDLSSGSLNTDYGQLSNIIQRQVNAKGAGFLPSNSRLLDKKYIYSANKRMPDDLMSSDLTTIKSDETEQFFVDDDVTDNFYSFEKSMWSTISDEMMNMFSTALEFNNLIGQPNFKYHERYNMLDMLRDKFFDDVENDPDLEKFTSFYKWIDDSISTAVQQLVPASSRFSKKINNIVESHVLERSKFVHKLPLLTDFKSTEGSIKGHSEMHYDWQFGHAPIGGSESDHTLWQEDRVEKDGLREIIRISKNNHSIQSSGLTRREIDGSTRINDTYAIRRFSKTYNFNIVSAQTIHGGINFDRKKNLQLFHESISPAGGLGETSAVPQNVVTVGVGTNQGLVEEKSNNDISPRKKKLNFNAIIGNREGEEYGYHVLGNTVLPLNIMSGSVKTGFNSVVDTLYRSGSYFANLHHDTVGNYNETSTQGPFTEQHVGGLQYRHIDINPGTDGPLNRPEGWGLALKDHPVNGPDADGALGFIGVDYSAPYPSATSPKATRYREEHAKRPVNIKNIKTKLNLQKAGNYKNEIEIFQVSPTFQKTWAIEAYNDPNWDIVPPFVATALPSTTHYQTLLGIAPFVSGNVFGGGKNSNRQPDTTSLTMVAPIAGNTAGVSTFKVKGKDYIVDRDAIRISSLSNHPIFEIDTDATFTDNRIQTGSSNTDFYNNIRGSIVSNLPGAFNVTYNSFAGSFSKGIRFMKNSAHGLSITSSLGTELDSLTFTFSAWLDISTDASSVKYIYYETTSDGNGEGREILITAAGQLQFILNYTDNVAANKTDQYSYSNFRQNHAGTLTHLAIVKGSTALGDGVNATLYINGSATSWSVENSPVSSFSSPSTPNSPDLYHIGYKNGAPSFGHSSSPGTIDEVVLLKVACSSAQVAELYNSGTQWNTGSLSAINYSSHVVAYYSFEEDLEDVLDGRTITDEKGFRNLVIVDNDSSNNITQVDTSLLTDSSLFPSASFTITPNTTGTYGNLTMTVNGSSFYSEAAGSGGIDAVAGVYRFSNDNVIAIPRTDLTGSQRNITTRFSAPGGPEVQSIGYLDAYTQTHAVHNAMPFRNLSVLGSGSGEEGTIRVEDHLGLRRGLRTLRGLHMGQFGIDSQYGTITSANYPSNGSFNKQHRNKSSRMEYSGSSIITGSAFDNMHINSPIPRSELQYSWIHNAISGSDAPNQNILGYAPRDGIVSSSAGFVDAIVFPSASSIFAY